MTKRLNHAPADCPVCGNELITIRKGCRSCGTELVGEFSGCEFCVLDETELKLLKVFLTARGNLREVEKHLAVSYPTARLRLKEVLAKLGLAQQDDDSENQDSPSEQEQILAQVAAGKISPEDAATLLG
ncbi:MAG: hypothetical protein CR979_00750, partial [Propionibacterium sp.]